MLLSHAITIQSYIPMYNIACDNIKYWILLYSMIIKYMWFQYYPIIYSHVSSYVALTICPDFLGAAKGSQQKSNIVPKILHFEISPFLKYQLIMHFKIEQILWMVADIIGDKLSNPMVKIIELSIHLIFIWVNYNISLTWVKAIWGWFPLLTMIPVRSEWGRYNLPRNICW